MADFKFKNYWIESGGKPTILLEILKQHGLDLGDASCRTGGRGKKIFVIGASFREIAKAHVICTGAF